MVVLTIRQQLYRTLKQRILDGVYPPGAHLNIDIIAREQGVSNSPLREAMTLLVKDRLVENRPNAGMYVIEITPLLYRELVDTINTTREAHVITIEDPLEYLHQHKKSVLC